ncbi:MAG: hypothetical protein ORN26_00275 [Candidatus Pacebacteria bacterium]|nr:hypothetical protein [Candidatus Paceibacterota bacterium]
MDVFNYYNKGKVVSERGPTPGELYVKLKEAKDKEISLQIEEEKKRLKEKTLKEESIEYVSNAVADDFLNKNYENDVAANIEKLKSELETLRKRDGYVSGSEEEKLLLSSIDDLYNKQPNITDTKVIQKDTISENKVQDNVVLENKIEEKIEDKLQNKDDNSHIEQATQVFVKGEDKMTNNNPATNMSEMKSTEYNYSTSILAFVDAILLIIIILMAIYMLVY